MLCMNLLTYLGEWSDFPVKLFTSLEVTVQRGLIFFSILYSTPLWKEDNTSSEQRKGSSGFTNTWYTLDGRMSCSSDQQIKLNCFLK